MLNSSIFFALGLAVIGALFAGWYARVILRQSEAEQPETQDDFHVAMQKWARMQDEADQ